MNIELRYGRKGLKIDLPSEGLAGVLRLNPTPALTDPVQSIRDALSNPLATPPLAKLALGRKSAVVVISDITRPVPNKIILPPILQVLESAGISRKKTTILVGGGLHRPSTKAEIVEMMGSEIADSYKVIGHDGHSLGALVHIGDTASGTPAWINRHYLEADLKITTALIEPHFMAGFSGGRKAVVPGCAGVETMKILHGPSILENPACREGSLDNNPLHREATDIARMAGVDFILNVTLDEKRRLTGVFAGDLEVAHLTGCELAREQATAFIEQPVDVVVTSSAGYPLDLTFYQTVKAMTAALPLLKEGGVILIASRCEEGIGSPAYRDLMSETRSVAEFRERMWDSEQFVYDQWQMEEQCKALESAEIWLYSEGLIAEVMDGLFVTHVESIERGLNAAMKRAGPGATYAVIPEGPYVMPRLTTHTAIS